VSRLGAVLLMVVTALFGGAGTAGAHATFVSSDPADGASLASAPQRVTLVFDEPLPQGLNTVAITGPGQTRWETGDVSTTGNTISTAMKPSAPAGDYIVGYRIVSEDGHPLTGTVRFRLTTSGASAQPPPATTTAPETAAGGQPTQPPESSRIASQPATGSAAPVWPWVAGGLALVVVGGGAAVLLRRRNSAAR
jgi:methionine-rich copper-binding protein CopC